MSFNSLQYTGEIWWLLFISMWVLAWGKKVRGYLWRERDLFRRVSFMVKLVALGTIGTIEVTSLGECRWERRVQDIWLNLKGGREQDIKIVGQLLYVIPKAERKDEYMGTAGLTTAQASPTRVKVYHEQNIIATSSHFIATASCEGIPPRLYANLMDRIDNQIPSGLEADRLGK